MISIKRQACRSVNRSRVTEIGRFIVLVFALLLITASASAQTIEYTITVDPADLSAFSIEMKVPAARGSVRLAMAAHPEYDDRYFRYVQDFTAHSLGREFSFTKPDPAVWQVEGLRGPLTVRYRVVPPAKEREWKQTWKPFLTPTGGMVGDLHMLMYVVGKEQARATLRLQMPAGWKAASGLVPTRDPRVFSGSVEDILDSPVIVGRFANWKFNAAGIPHQVVIWSPSDAKAVNPKPIVDGISTLVNESIKAFGRPPYPRYAFLLENGGSAALEHNTSLNTGLTGDLSALFDDIAHEYIHVWNLMDVRPRERIGVRYKFAEPTGVLWWSEGATIMFSDLLIRRSSLPKSNESRTARLESTLARYHSAPGYWKLSAETVSRGDSHPELMGNEFASTHLQGELLVTALDLLIRDRTDNRRSATDVQRLLSSRFDSRRGIDNRDLERAVAETCACDVRPFFRDYIYNAKPIDINHYLAMIGLSAEIRQIEAVDDQGRPVVDRHIGPVSGEGEFRVRLLSTASTWARAGLHTGDRVISADDKPISTWNDFRGWLVTLKIGDKARLKVRRDGKDETIEVPMKPFTRATVTITERTDSTMKQQRLRDAWLSSR
jgi:predicted metalloprotease with PDZ domain